MFSASYFSRAFLIIVLGSTLACGGGGGGPKETADPGKLWVQPSPAFLTPGANLVFQAVPEIHSEGPILRTAAWSVLESNGGSVLAIGNGQTATYTAPPMPGTFHLQAVSEYGTSHYVPQPGTVQVVDPKGVTVSVSPAAFVIKRDFSGSFPEPLATLSPLTNRRVQWSVVEPGFEGPDLIRLTPYDTVSTCLISWNGAAAIDRLPGNLFHVRAQSVEAPSAFALIEVQVQR